MFPWRSTASWCVLVAVAFGEAMSREAKEGIYVSASEVVSNAMCNPPRGMVNIRVQVLPLTVRPIFATACDTDDQESGRYGDSAIAKGWLS